MNDFDEAWPASYASDLVRLLASAYLAIDEQHLAITRTAAREAMEEGIATASRTVAAHRTRGTSPLAATVALSKLRDPVVFWQKILRVQITRASFPRCAEAGASLDAGEDHEV